MHKSGKLNGEGQLFLSIVFYLEFIFHWNNEKIMVKFELKNKIWEYDALNTESLV